MTPATDKIEEAKPLKTTPWVDFSQIAYENALKSGVHFSSKLVNTIADGVGVRLPVSGRSALALVGFSTTKLNRQLTDYTAGGAGNAKIYSQMNSVIDGSVDDRYAGCSQGQKDFIRDALKVLEQGALIKGEYVDPRLRQVHFPLPDGSTVLLTPLHSGIFSAELDARNRQEKTSHPDRKHRHNVTLGIGGSNPQNAGIFARASQKILAFSAPRESMEVRIACATFYQGVTLASLLPVDLLNAFGDWRKNHMEKKTPWTMDLRQEEESRTKAIARSVLAQADRRSADVEHHAPWLGSPVSDDVDDMSLGLLDKSKRSTAWNLQFGADLVNHIELHRNKKGKPDDPTLSSWGELHHLVKIVQEIARSITPP